MKFINKYYHIPSTDLFLDHYDYRVNFIIKKNHFFIDFCYSSLTTFFDKFEEMLNGLK